MHLRLPRTLHYPITVIDLLRQPNDHVERTTPLFSYFYKTTVTEGDKFGNTKEVEKTFPTRFESTVEGVLKTWNIQPGMVIDHEGLEVAEFEEACAHGVQYGGMCVNCGKDMTELSYITSRADATRAPINMIHDNVALTVSEDEATKVEEEAKRRLIGARKLSLVVDLDQTIIHATVDPTVAEWQKDPDNPNHDAVKDVRSFQLTDDAPGMRGAWYHIKLRPGLKEFLQNVSKLYELHIYTMGTRAYAQHIAEIVDPERKIFGDRILSRDESGSLVAKNLQRLFPVDTKMVVIIDDRGDVWKWNENLIRVTPYDFFVGIGDINSSFLPKKPQIMTTPKAETPVPPKPSPNGEGSESAIEIHVEAPVDGSPPTVDKHASNGVNTEADSNVSALEQLVSMGGGDNPDVLQSQISQQDQTLAAQMQDRPLLQKQKQLEAEEDAASETAKEKGSDDTSSDEERPSHHHHILQDHDNELYHLETSLRKVHAEFFDVHAKGLAGAQGGRIAELRGTPHAGISKATAPTSSLDLDLIPDIKTIMPSIKKRVLNHVVIVFSGVVPLGIDIQLSDIAFWAKSFGARVTEKVTKRTTHVIAARNRTAKVRQAVICGQGKIKIVGTQWLMDCIVQWNRLDETPYLLKTEEGDAAKPRPGEEGEFLSDSASPASALDTDTDLTESEAGDRLIPGPRLKIRTGNVSGNVTDDEDLAGVIPGAMDDEQSPVGGTNADWQEMHDELEDFLGSDMDDSDADGDSQSSNESGQSGSKGGPGKRNHLQMSGAQDDDPPKKKLALARYNGLTEFPESGLPTPDLTVEENAIVGGVDERVEDDDGWSAYEGDLAAEMERVTNEEEQGEG